MSTLDLLMGGLQPLKELIIDAQKNIADRNAPEILYYQRIVRAQLALQGIFPIESINDSDYKMPKKWKPIKNMEERVALVLDALDITI